MGKTKKLLNDNAQYVTAVAFMIALGIIAAVLITLFRPEQDNLPVITLIFGSIAPTTLALLAFMKAQQTHLSVNSRLDAFIKNAEGIAKAAGVEQGRQEANARTDKLKENL